MATQPPDSLNDLLAALAEACNAVTPLLTANSAQVDLIDDAVEALAPRFDEAIEHLREAIQAQTRLLTQTAARLTADADDAVAALDSVPEAGQQAGAAIDGLRRALENGAHSVADARATYSRIVSDGVEALELALERYGQAAQGTADTLKAAYDVATGEMKESAATLDQARVERMEQESHWAEAIDALVAGSAGMRQPLAEALAEGASEQARAAVDKVNEAIDAYHDLVAPDGSLYPRFMVVNDEAVADARDALAEALETLDKRITSREDEVLAAEEALLGELPVMAPGLTAPRDDLQAVVGVNG